MSPKEESVTGLGKEYDEHLMFFFIFLLVYTHCAKWWILWHFHLIMSSTLIIFTPLLYPHLFFLLLLLVFLSIKSPSSFHMYICVSVTYVYGKSRFHIGEKTCYLSFWQISLNRMLSVLNHTPANDMSLLLMADYDSMVNRLYFLYPFLHASAESILRTLGSEWPWRGLCSDLKYADFGSF